MRHIYTSVDIGSDTIKIAVCELYRGRYNLLSATSTKSNGIKKGLITDVSEATSSLKKAFSEIESMLGFKIKKCIANVPSYFTEFTVIKSEIDILNESITGNDVIKSLQLAMKDNMIPNKEMVTILPIDFVTDDGITKEPIGSVSKKLLSRAIMVSTPRKNIISVVSLFNNIGVDLVDISLGCIGDIYAFKNENIDDNITSVVNIGLEKTEVTLYNKGIAVKHNIVNMGSKNVDNDIAYVYKVDLETARNLKEKFALAYKNQASLSETKEVYDKNGETVKIIQYEISEIVSARISEILTLVNQEINTLSNHKPRYIYVTGGITNMINFNQICTQKLGNCAIIGNVNLIGLRNNKYSQCFGNIVYFVNKLKLKEKDYSMVSTEDMEILSSPKRNVSSNNMLGKVFGYFFGE